MRCGLRKVLLPNVGYVGIALFGEIGERGWVNNLPKVASALYSGED